MNVVNYLSKTTKVEESNVDFSYYVERANRIINKVNGRTQKKTVKVDEQQLSLFKPKI